MAIRIKVNNKKLDVTPETQDVRWGASTQWTVEVGAGQSVEIEFHKEDGKDGPFEHKNNPDNPKRGRYKKDKSGSIESNKVDEKVEKKWKYDVILREGGKEVDRKDPYIKTYGP